MSAFLPGLDPPLTVSQLNRQVRELIESELDMVWVAGELSNVKLASSGHWYFCLKDAEAAVDAAMFQGRARFLDFKPVDGMKVEARARVTLYEPRGKYQLVVEELRKSGLGALHEAFEKLKTRLGAEGLFDPDRKRELPLFPRAIGLVTSPAAAALRDMLTTLRRRAPMIPVILYPAPVQGGSAAPRIAAAIETANARREVDVLVVARGGGSLEDLWAFNEEIVARAIAESIIPVVSGVGHETDFTIADFAADLRAPTPTAAAAAASPDREALAADVAALRRRLSRDLQRILETQTQRLDALARRLLTPAERIARQRETLALHARRLRNAVAGRMELHAARLKAQRTALGHLDPTQVLGRGYSIVRDADGHIRHTSEGLAPDAALDITFSKGGAGVRVVKVEKSV